MKKSLKILCWIAIIGLVCLCIVFIIIPIRFAEEKRKRDAEVIQRLMEIQKAQLAYYNTYGEYAYNMDTLIEKKFIPDSIRFIQGTNMPIEMGVGTEETTTSEKLTLTRYGNPPLLDSIHAILDGNMGLKTAFKLFGIGSKRFIKQPDGTLLDSISSIWAEMGDKPEIREIGRSTRSTSKLLILQVPYRLYLSGLNRWEVKRLIQKAERVGQYPGLRIKLTNEPATISPIEIDYN